MSVRLLLIRHGESVLGRAKRYAGHRNTSLTPKGRAEASRLRSRIEKFHPDLIFSSDLRRCRDTAALMAPGRAIRTSARLRELDFGVWDGLTAETCRRRDPKRFDRWMRDPWSTSPPGGESLSRLWDRVRSFVAELVRSHPDRSLAIVTHGGPLRALLALRRSAFWSREVPTGSVFSLLCSGRRYVGG